jgi:AcrR family transcriptional regulator
MPARRGSAPLVRAQERSPGVELGSAESGVSPQVVCEVQRSRLLGAAVVAVEELGYAQATVAHITTRARVSRRTFYDLFANREECLLAVLEDTVARLSGELAAEGLEELVWRERVRVGLWRILCFFDREPALARLCVVQSARGGQRVLERREELLAALARVVDEGRAASPRGQQCPSLAAEGVVGAALSILYTRLLKRDERPLAGLLGELMSLVVLPYLGSSAARREHTRSAPVLPAPGQMPASVGRALECIEDPLAALPMRLTYRTARVLEDIAENPGVSNRVVAERAGIVDQGQVSKLLARLERLGLVQNTGAGHIKGEPNAWQLTPTGQQITQSIRSNGRYPQQAA